MLLKDVRKLARKKLSSTEDGKAYLLIAGRRQKLSDSKIPTFVSAHAKDELKHHVLTSIKSIAGGENVRLRPSRKQLSDGLSFVMTWEILVDKK